MNKDEKWMEVAINEARKAKSKNEVPVGAVLVKDGNIIAKAHNQPIAKNDPTAHAEILVLRIAGEKLQNYRLNESTLFVTLEPCIMCLGAITHARLERVVFGAFDQKSGACGSCLDIEKSRCLNHKIKIDGGILEQRCKKLLITFFNNRRK